MWPLSMKFSLSLSPSLPSLLFPLSSLLAMSSYSPLFLKPTSWVPSFWNVLLQWSLLPLLHCHKLACRFFLIYAQSNLLSIFQTQDVPEKQWLFIKVPRKLPVNESMLSGTTKRLRDRNQTLPLRDRMTQDHSDLALKQEKPAAFSLSKMPGAPPE